MEQIFLFCKRAVYIGVCTFPREYIPLTYFFCKLAVYICNVLFLSVRTECRDGSRHPPLFILFRAAEKERTKKKAAARNSHSFENVCHC